MSAKRHSRTPICVHCFLNAPSVMGLESMDVDQFVVRVVARTLPGKQFEVGRDLRERIANAFRAEGIIVAGTLETADPPGATPA